MIIGIDLGTTNSLAAIWRDGETRLVPNSFGETLTPSVVSLDRDGEILVGAAARERMVSHPDRTAAAFKRYMGTDRAIPLGPRAFRPEELSSFVLRALKSDAEALLGTEVAEAVITVPAYFSDAQRKATRIAGELAGLRVERVLNEPTAAALAYGLQERGSGQDGRILVFDLGGGTFDVSILDLFDGVMEVRATAGDTYLGGEDFDDALVAWFVDATGLAASGAAAGPEAVTAARLRRLVEQARRRLDDHPEAEIVLAQGGRTVSATLTAEIFTRLSAPLLERLRRPVLRALRDSRIRLDELSQIVLVGGATRMPIVRRLAATLFERLPLQRINPDEVVARGAAVQAALKMRQAELRDVVLTDVSPYTLGIEIVERAAGGAYSPGRFLPIIERNSVVPVSRAQQVGPTADFQQSVEIRIFQGESRLVKDNIRLGALRMTLKPRRQQEQLIEVRFTYDINGILEVAARSLQDGAVERLVIEENPGLLSAEEVAARLDALSALKIHPRDQAPNRLLLARAERVFEESLGPERRAIGEEIARFEAALASQAPDAIAPAAERLRAVLLRADAS